MLALTKHWHGSGVQQSTALAVAEADDSAAAANVNAIPHEGPLSAPDLVNYGRQKLACTKLTILTSYNLTIMSCTTIRSVIIPLQAMCRSDQSHPQGWSSTWHLVLRARLLRWQTPHAACCAPATSSDRSSETKKRTTVINRLMATMLDAAAHCTGDRAQLTEHGHFKTAPAGIVVWCETAESLRTLYSYFASSWSMQRHVPGYALAHAAPSPVLGCTDGTRPLMQEERREHRL